MKLVRMTVLAAAAALLPLQVLAQAFPNKPIKLIVPFPAGGPADIFARYLAQGMTGELGQQVVIENVSGVGGVLGVDRAAKSAPDGYTLVLNSSSSVTIAPFSMAKMPYDPGKDLTLLTTVVKVPEVLVVNPALGVNSLAELVAQAKANPGKINFGSAGSGTITHLGGELLKVEASVNLVHVPYKGAAPAVNDMLGGQVQMGIFDVPVVLSHIRAGKLKALSVTSARRAPSLPDVPTTAEGGYPKVLSDNWYGLVGPAGLPPAVARRLHAAAVKTLNSKDVIEQYGKVSGIPMPSTPEEYAIYIAQEQRKWGAVVKAIGFKAE